MRFIIFVIFVSFLHNAFADTYHYTNGPSFPIAQVNNSTCTIEFWMPVGDINYSAETDKCTQSQTNNYHYKLTAHTSTTYTIPYSSGYCTSIGNLVLGSSLSKTYTFSNVQPDGSCTITSSWGASVPNSNTPTQLGVCNAFSADFDYPACIASKNTGFDTGPTTPDDNQCPAIGTNEIYQDYPGLSSATPSTTSYDSCVDGCLYSMRYSISSKEPDGTWTAFFSGTSLHQTCTGGGQPSITGTDTTTPTTTDTSGSTTTGTFSFDTSQLQDPYVGNGNIDPATNCPVYPSKRTVYLTATAGTTYDGNTPSSACISGCFYTEIAPTGTTQNADGTTTYAFSIKSADQVCSDSGTGTTTDTGTTDSGTGTTTDTGTTDSGSNSGSSTDYSGYLQTIANNTHDAAQATENANSSISGKLDTANNYLAQIAANSTSGTGTGTANIEKTLDNAFNSTDDNLTIVDTSTIPVNEQDVKTTLQAELAANSKTISIPDSFDTTLFSTPTSSATHVITFTVMGSRYSIDLQPLFTLASLISVFLLIFATILSARIVTNSLN